MVGIIDYGVGNLFSLRSSFAAIGVEAFVSGDAGELAAHAHHLALEEPQALVVAVLIAPFKEELHP